MEATPHYFTDKDVQFHDLLFEYLDLAEKQLSSTEESEVLWNSVTELTYENEVSPPAFIRCASEVFKKYPLRHLFLIQMFEGMVSTRREKDTPHLYPEMLWIVVQENILNNLLSTLRVFDVINHICRIVDRNVVRAYLNYVLINEGESKHADLVRSYYYTGHTIDSLKIVNQVVRFPEDDFDLLNYHYLNAMSFMFNPKSASLKPEEKFWLKSYFMKGITIGHPEISDSCHKALAQLGKMM
jgi:hypothetical protein